MTEDVWVLNRSFSQVRRCWRLDSLTCFIDPCKDNRNDFIWNSVDCYCRISLNMVFWCATSAGPNARQVEGMKQERKNKHLWKGL